MGLLQLPTEIRAKILLEVIKLRVDQPTNPSQSQNNRTTRDNRYMGHHGVWQLSPRNPALSLLLTSKQIQQDTQWAIQNVATQYHVDIMFVKSYGLWTTWSIPKMPPTQYIDSVQATFRIFEPTEDLDEEFEGSMDFRGGCGGPPLAVWAFHRLLLALFTSGPGSLGVGHAQLEDLKPEFVVKELLVDVLPPSDGRLHTSVVWEDEKLKSTTDTAFWETDPDPHDASIPAEDRLARLLASNLDTILRIIFLDYGALVFECVMDRIVFRVNGEVYRVYDIEQMLPHESDVEYWGSSSEQAERRSRNFTTWKIWLDTRRHRMRNNLPLNNSRPVTKIWGY